MSHDKSLPRFDTCRNSSCTSASIVFGQKIYFNISFLLLGLAVACLNATVIYVLFQKWRTLRKGKRFAFALNLAVSDFLIGPVLLCVSIVDLMKNDNYVLTAILQVIICFNVQLTLTNFTSFLIAQYYAIKHPLYYRTRFTTARVILLIAISWTVSGLFTCAKYFLSLKRLRYDIQTGFLYFPHIEQGVRNCFFILNTSLFVYVFVVALSRKRRHVAMYGGRNSQGETRQDSTEGESFLSTADTSGSTVLKRHSHSFMSNDVRNYRAIMAAGARLLVYFCTSIPINAYYCYFLATHHAKDFVRAYLDVKGTIAGLFILWFLRAVADPMITLVTEKRPRASLSSNDSRNSSINSSKAAFFHQTSLQARQM